MNVDSLISVVYRVGVAVRRAIWRRRTAVALRHLDDYMLSDIGVRRSQIGRVARQAALERFPEIEGEEPNLAELISLWSWAEPRGPACGRSPGDPGCGYEEAVREAVR